MRSVNHLIGLRSKKVNYLPNASQSQDTAQNLYHEMPGKQHNIVSICHKTLPDTQSSIFKF